MTLEQLVALPVGTRIGFVVDEEQIQDGKKLFEYGTIVRSGNEVHITWDQDENLSQRTSIIDTKSSIWSPFVSGMEVA
jgi:hypothetical protein